MATSLNQVAGLPELLGKLDAVAKDAKGKGGRFALRKSAQLVQRDAISRARRLDDPGSTERIWANIAVRWSGRRHKRTGDLMFRVGVLGGAQAPDTAAKQRRRRRLGNTSLADLGELSGAGKGNPGGDTWYWRFLEFGTDRIPSGKFDFLQQALATNTDAATAKFITEFNKALDRAIKRAQKKGVTP